jgi:hypothetical protein
MLFGSSSFTRLLILPFQPRYVFPLIPIIGLSLAFMSGEISARIRTLLIIATTASVCLAVAGSLSRAGDRDYEGYLRNVRSGLESVKGSGSIVYTDERTRAGLRHLLSKQEWKNVNAIPGMGRFQPGLYVLSPNTELEEAQIRQVRSLPVAFVIQTDQRMIARMLPQLAGTAKYEAVFRLRK